MKQKPKQTKVHFLCCTIDKNKSINSVVNMYNYKQKHFTQHLTEITKAQKVHFICINKTTKCIQQGLTEGAVNMLN